MNACVLTMPWAVLLSASVLAVSSWVLVWLVLSTIAHPPVASGPATTGTGGRGVVGPRTQRAPLREVRSATPTSKGR